MIRKQHWQEWHWTLLEREANIQPAGGCQAGSHVDFPVCRFACSSLFRCVHMAHMCLFLLPRPCVCPSVTVCLFSEGSGERSQQMAWGGEGEDVVAWSGCSEGCFGCRPGVHVIRAHFTLCHSKGYQSSQTESSSVQWGVGLMRLFDATQTFAMTYQIQL